MDDDRARRALPRRALVLVVPAAVVEPRLAREQLRIVQSGSLFIITQDLALDVHALEVVPLVLGRLDAVADEHHLGVLELRLRRLHAGLDGEVLVEREIGTLAAALCTKDARGVGGHAHELEALEPRAVGRSRLEPEALETRGDVGLGELSAAATGAAALEEVVREEANVGANPFARIRRAALFSAGVNAELAGGAAGAAVVAAARVRTEMRDIGSPWRGPGKRDARL